MLQFVDPIQLYEMFVNEESSGWTVAVDADSLVATQKRLRPSLHNH